MDTPDYIRKVVIEKSEVKVDIIEDRKLKTLYDNGKSCGKRDDVELIQVYIKDQLTFHHDRKIKVRAFLYIASYEPLVVYFSQGYILLERYSFLYCL